MTRLQRLIGVFFACCLVVAACGDDGDMAEQLAADGGEDRAAEDGDDESGTKTETQPSVSADPSGSASGSSASSTSERPVVSIDSTSETTAVSTTETSATEAPATETPATETPATETPATETSATPGTTSDPPVTETSAPLATAAPVTQPAVRNLGEQGWTPFATFEDVTLYHPSINIERIGFHESNHDGARQLVPVDGAVNPIVLDSRDRGTGSRTAADIVVEPGTEVRAPVTGTVIRAGGYILYCRHNDDFVVIEPDAHPGWEVKVLHVSGITVSAGDRVEAGVTVLAPAATQLPFDSQVDEFTAEPSWPHVHVELVDPSIPDRPSKGGGC